MDQPIPIKGQALTFTWQLVSQVDGNIFQVNPTLATGDFKLSKDGGAFANLTNLPTVTPAGGSTVEFVLTSTEMNANRIAVECKDAAGAEWADTAINILTLLTDKVAATITSGDVTGVLPVNVLQVEGAGARTIIASTVVSGLVTYDAATGSDVSAVETDTQDIQSRLPAALISGKMDSYVSQFAPTAITSGSFAAGAINAEAIGIDAIGSSELAASAITEIQAGLASQTSVDDLPTNAELATALASADDATLAAIAVVQADTDNIQTRLPAALTGDGNMKVDVLKIEGADPTDTLAAGTVAGLGTYDAATGTDVSAVETDTQDIQSRLPAALVTGRMVSYVEAMAVDTITSGSVATSAANEIATAVNAGAVAGLTQADVRTAVGLGSANLDSQLSGIQSDTNDIQARIPASLTGDGNIKADVLKIEGADPTDTLAAGAVAGLGTYDAATGTDVSNVETDTQDIQSRLPAALVNGKMNSYVTQFAPTAITSGSFAAGAIDQNALATDAIGASEVSAAAVSKIQSGLASQTSVDDLPTNSELNSALASADDTTLAAIALVQADTDDIQNRLPDTLVNGRMKSYVGEIADNAITSGAIATSALQEIQAALPSLTQADIRTAIGLLTANLDTQLSNIQSDTNDLQTRLPAALTSDGNIKADTLNIEGAGARNILASSAVSGLTTYDAATGTDVSNVETDTQNIQSRIPSALVDGRMDSHVGSMASGTVTAAAIAAEAINAAKLAAGALDANALATDAITEIVAGLLAGIIEGTVTLKQSLQLSNAALAGKLEGADTDTLTFRDLADSKDRITATVDLTGRTNIVLSLD